jgi:hypothetical protein
LQVSSRHQDDHEPAHSSCYCAASLLRSYRAPGHLPIDTQLAEWATHGLVSSGAFLTWYATVTSPEHHALKRTNLFSSPARWCHPHHR